MAVRSSCWVGHELSGCDPRKDHGPRVGRVVITVRITGHERSGGDRRKDHEYVLVISCLLVTSGEQVGRMSTCWAWSKHVGYIVALLINWINIIILSVIMFMFIVSFQVHSMYWPGVSCQISGKSCWKGVLSESRPCPRRCPCAMESRYDVVPLPSSCHDRGPFMFTK